MDQKLKILLVHPGASISTHDVYVGLHDGLIDAGHTVWEYALDNRIAMAGKYLDYCWKKGGKHLARPGQADVLYKAGEELVARALRVMPDWVLVVSAMYLHPDVFVLLRRAHLRVAVLFTESPYDDPQQAKVRPFAEVAWTNDRESARALSVEYMPHAWHSGIHVAEPSVEPLQPNEMAAHDVVFVGTGFEERVDALAAVDWAGLGIDLGLYGNWELLGSRHKLRPFVCGSYIRNVQAVELYRRAKVGLNLYRTSRGFGRGVPKVTYAESLNPRAYELAALGRFAVSDWRPEVDEVFGDLVPTFKDAKDLGPLLRRWLDDDDGRRAIEAQLPAAVAGMTWRDRARQVSEDLRRAGTGARAASSEAATAVAGG